MVYIRLFITLFTLLGAIGAARAETWRLASIEWPPYAGAQLPDQGLAVNVLRTALAERGITLEVDFMPWNRAVQRAKQGRYIGYFPAWPEEVEPGFVASGEVATSTVGLISYRGSGVVWRGLEKALAYYRTGLVSSYVYSPEISAQLRTQPKNLRYVASDRDLIRVLHHKRVVLALTDPRLVEYYAALDGYDNLEVVRQELEVKPLVVALTDSQANRAQITLLKALFDH
ncbi:MAG: substrate-binding periplasmic protein [Pseudomonadales bacterium]